MDIGAPEVPAGVRPISGDHVSHVEIGRATHLWRRAANLARVSALRARHHPPVLPEAPRYPKVFVVGCPRSGTSWVQGILSRHPLVVTSQESHAYANIYAPVAARGRQSIAAWTKVLQRHDIGEREKRWVGLHWWLNRGELLDLIEWAFAADGLSAEEAAETVIAAMFDSYFLGRGGDESHTLLEKTPAHLAYAGRILRRFPEARVIEVLRDGRDVCVSMQMRALTMSWPPRSRAEQIRTWVRAVQCGLDLRADAAVADRVHLVKYETLKAAPEQEIARLFEFTGLEADHRFVADVADRSDFRHYSSTGDGQHARRGEVGDWRNHFDSADERLFRELAGDAFTAAGYQF